MRYSGAGYELAAEIIRRLTGKNLSEFAKERLFDPLSMKDTFYVVPDNAMPNIARRKDSDPRGDWLNNWGWEKIPSASAGAYSSIDDMAIFAQMLLNKGIYNDTRIFSPRAVELMTHNQIPGIEAWYQGQTFHEASWSYGWNIKGTKVDDGSCYRSPHAFCHSGSGGVFLLVDPRYDVIIIDFHIEKDHGIKAISNVKHLFSNLVISAIEDE
jgi:CubicO group peptidase (beta-lactamase class C family)